MRRKQKLLYGFLALLFVALAVSGYFLFSPKSDLPSDGDQLAQDTWAPEEFILRERPYFQECVKELQFMAVGVENSFLEELPEEIRTDEDAVSAWVVSEMDDQQHLRESLRILPYVLSDDDRIELERRWRDASGFYPYQEEVYQQMLTSLIDQFASELGVYQYIVPDEIQGDARRIESFWYAHGPELWYTIETYPYFSPDMRARGYARVAELMSMSEDEVTTMFVRLIQGENYVPGQIDMLSRYTDGFVQWRTDIDLPAYRVVASAYYDQFASFATSPLLRSLMASDMFHRIDHSPYDGSPYRVFAMCAFGPAQRQEWIISNLDTVTRLLEERGAAPTDEELSLLGRALSFIEEETRFDAQALLTSWGQAQSPGGTDEPTMEWVLNKQIAGMFAVVDAADEPMETQEWQQLGEWYRRGTSGEVTHERWPIIVQAIINEMSNRDMELTLLQ